MENTFNYFHYIYYIRMFLCIDQLQKNYEKEKYFILILSKFKCRLKDYYLIKFISLKNWSHLPVHRISWFQVWGIYIYIYNIRIFVGRCGLTSRSSWYFMVKKLFSLCKVHRLVRVARVKWSAIVYRDTQCTETCIGLHKRMRSRL